MTFLLVSSISHCALAFSLTYYWEWKRRLWKPINFKLTSLQTVCVVFVLTVVCIVNKGSRKWHPSPSWNNSLEVEHKLYFPPTHPPKAPRTANDPQHIKRYTIYPQAHQTLCVDSNKQKCAAANNSVVVTQQQMAVKATTTTTTISGVDSRNINATGNVETKKK